MNKQIILQLDRPRKLAMDFNAITYLYEVGGINLLEGIDIRVLKEPRNLLLFITACLQTDAEDHGEELTSEQVARLMDLRTMVEFSQAFQGLVADALPEDTGEEKEGDELDPPEKPLA